jgi:hypothetical protein
MERKIDPAVAREKLEMLVDEHDCTFEELVESRSKERTFPGICMRRGCLFIEDYGRREGSGWCEECGTASVVSGLVLAEIGGRAG